MRRTRNHDFRENWVQSRLGALPPGQSILDVGAGEGAFRPFCTHLEHVAQDVAQYDGRARRVRRQYSGWWLDPLSAGLLFAARLNVRLLARLDGPRDRRRSAELQTFGWHVVARRRETAAAAGQ